MPLMKASSVVPRHGSILLREGSRWRGAPCPIEWRREMERPSTVQSKPKRRSVLMARVPQVRR